MQTNSDIKELEMLFDDPLEVLSSCIRNFVHSPGSKMLDGDFSAIEARIACWLAGQEDALEEYRQGVDRYKLIAAEIYEIPVNAVTKDQREVGKRACLGLSYQMGTDKFMSSCWELYGIRLSKEIAEKAKVTFRQMHDKIRDHWNFLDRSARDAIQTPGKCCGPFVVRQVEGMSYLFAKLRSGRYLAYPRPRIVKRDPTIAERKQMAEGWKFHENHFMEITYWGQLPLSTTWGSCKLYGGKLFENFCQGTAADFMAYGAIEAERLGMPSFALIHDQGLAIQEEGKTPEMFAAALATLPPWATGMPLKVEAHLCDYYTKD
jgi:DNA polymerase